MLDIDPAALEHLVGCLAEQEEQGALIHPHTARVCSIQKLYFPVVVNPEFESLGDIVDLGGNDGVRSVKFKFREHFQERGTFHELLVAPCVLAINGNHLS